MSTATIWLKDEINCVVLGLTQDHTEILWNQFKLHPANYFFNPKFKMGSWDGYIRFFLMTGTTYTYLLPKIIPRLIKWGYTIEVKDDRVQGHHQPLPVDKNIFSEYCNEYDEPFILRWYQVELVDVLLKNSGGIAIAGTASGKSIIGASIAKSYETFGLKTIIIVPTTTLVLQLATDLKLWGLDVGQMGNKAKELDRTHLVTTWQSLQNVPTVLKDYDVCIIDECQGAKALVLSNMLKKEGRHIRYRFGLTGTMPKEPMEALQIRLSLGDELYEIPAHTLIEEGVLSTLNINIMELEENFPKDYFPDYGSETKYLRGNTDRCKWIADHSIRIADPLMSNGPTNVMMLVSSVAFGKKMHKLIPNSHFVYGKDDTACRREIYNLYKSEDNLIVITTVQVAGTGLSIDRIFNLVMVDLGKSFVRVIQAVGRGLRKNVKAGKTHCEMFDMCSNLKYSKQHLRKRKAFYKESKYPYETQKINDYKVDF